MKSKNSFAFIFLIIPLTWAGSFIAGKYVILQVDPLGSVILRFLFSAIVMLPGLLLFHINRHPRISEPGFVKHMIIVILTAGIGYHVFFFWALEYSTPTNTALIIALNPFFTSFAEILVFRKKRPAKFYFGFIIAFTGAIWVNLSRGGDISLSSLGYGELFALIAAIFWSVYTISAKATKRPDWDSLWINAYNYLFTGLLLIPFSIQLFDISYLDSLNTSTWAGLWYMAIFPTAIGYTLFYVGVQKKGPAWASTFIYLVPSFTAILDFIFFEMQLTTALVLGTILVITGLFLGNIEIRNTTKTKLSKLRKMAR